MSATRWKTSSIFISSTFRDMHAERDWLRNHVFPELEERLAERRIRLEPIDLRWGVEAGEQSESRELAILKVCLAEIERARPFFIGLLGEYVLKVNTRLMRYPLVVEKERLNFENVTPQDDE